MTPETGFLYLQPQHLAAAQTRQERVRDEFATEYVRNQSIFSVFNRGRDRLVAAAASLRVATSTLAEFRARSAASAVPPADFRRVYSETFAGEQVCLSEDAVRSAVNHNIESGLFNNVYSGWLNANAAGAGLIVGAGLAGVSMMVGVDSQTSQNLMEAAVISGAVGLDAVREGILNATTRLAGAGGRVAEIARRWSSSAEGWVTGDIRVLGDPDQRPNVLTDLSNEAETALAGQLEERLTSAAVSRPATVDQVTALRVATEDVSADFDLIAPTIRAQSAARSSRMLRIGALGLVAAAVLTHHFFRAPDFQPAPNCGTVDFRSPDWINGAEIGNPDAHSLTGYAQARLLRHVNGTRPDFNSGAGWDQLRNLYEDDAIGYIVDGIRVALPEKNGANLRFLTSDLVAQVGPVPVADLCPAEVEAIAKNAPRKTTGLRP